MNGPEKERGSEARGGAEFDDDADFEWDDDEHLSVPAGPLRVVLGLMLMLGGVVAAALSDKAWVKYAGAIAFLASLFVMLKRPDKMR